jgi:hypothetical protein
VPDDVSCELKRSAHCYVTSECCVGRRVSVVCNETLLQLLFGYFERVK